MGWENDPVVSGAILDDAIVAHFDIDIIAIEYV